MEHPVFTNLPLAQQDALNKLMPLLCSEGVSILRRKVRRRSTPDWNRSLATRTRSWSMSKRDERRNGGGVGDARGSTRPKPLLVSVKTFEGKDGENLLLWTREVEMVMGSALLQNEQQRVALGISKLGGRAREWALTCATIAGMFAPPNQAYRIRSHFLATRQGKKELLDYVQELRTLIAGTAVDPLPEAVTLTVFMEGLRTSAA
ncbi:hypothetical protein PI124_g12396 [Phytophthora idaei]|nr:hypothetical protein PI124_g12396 [Phytophthora idaei]